MNQAENVGNENNNANEANEGKGKWVKLFSNSLDLQRMRLSFIALEMK